MTLISEGAGQRCSNEEQHMLWRAHRVGDAPLQQDRTLVGARCKHVTPHEHISA
jgi:hypothetical protein